MTIYENAQQMTVYLQALTESKTAIDEGMSPPDGLIGQTLIDFLTSCRNRALAGDGLKASFMGTLSTEPTVTKAELLAREITSDGADMLINSRDTLRAMALGLVE